MKAFELSFNNWIYNRRDPEHKPYQAKKIDKNTVMDKDGRYLNLVDVRPIPLTPDILKSNNFECYAEDGRTTCWTSYGEDTSGDIEICFYYTFDETYNKMDEYITVKMDISGAYFNTTKIKYVHELQHALRVCQIEKEIKL